MRKIKKIKPSTLRRKCLQLWSYIVRQNAGFKCEYPDCKSDKFLQAHHVIGKRFKPTMFWTSNGVCLCAKCHKWGIGYSAHENPVKLTEYLKMYRPDDYDLLKYILPYPRPSDKKIDYEQELKLLEDEYQKNIKYLSKNKKTVCKKGTTQICESGKYRR